MTHADVHVSLPAPRSGNYEVARFNALRHGVLSQHTVLPWEDGDEYRELLGALVAEHRPQGPTEEHLVEELAAVIWRKRRLRLAESAAHHRALKRAAEPLSDTATAALIHSPHSLLGSPSVAEAITATGEQTIADLADRKSDRNMTEAALRLLNGKSSNPYGRALAKLREDTRERWEEQLARKPADYKKDETPYSADAESLRRFLQTEIIPRYDKSRRKIETRAQIRAQAFGDAVEPDRLEGLARYEVLLDRKLERMVAMLLKLQELRGGSNPG
jgi:hypothetical protein